MREHLSRLKEQLSLLSLHGDDHELHGQITNDLRGLVLKDPDGKRRQALVEREGDCIFLCRRTFNPATIVTGPMSMHEGKGLAASIKYTLDNYFLDLENIELSKIHVKTPCVGRIEPSVEIIHFREGHFWEEMLAGEPIEMKLQYGQLLTYDGWLNGVNLKVGPGGLVIDGMTTIMPVAGLRGLEGLSEVRDRVQHLRVLLTLLNGGHHVEVEETNVHLVWRGKSQQETKMSFLLRDFNVLPYGLGDSYYKNRLARPNALPLVGMAGVKSWFEWCKKFENRHLLDFWLHTERKVAALVALEGLGRRLKHQDGCRGKVYFRKACETVLKKFDLTSVLNEVEIKALSLAHDKLVKHIGEVSSDVHQKHQHTLHLGAVLADFLVGYGILKDALGELPRVIKDAWRSEIENAGEQHRKAKRDWPGNAN